LFDFIEANNIVINENGNLIMYKIVKRTDDKEVFLDLYTKTFKQMFNVPVTMPRNQVDDNIEQTCSYGFHVCSWQYLPHYGSAVSGHDAILLCEVVPTDIVAIPRDYNNSKIRTCAYTPLSEYTYDKGEIDKVLYRNNTNLGDFEGDDKNEDYRYDDSNDEDDYYSFEEEDDDPYNGQR
jgi:regulator of replication initiation timing